MPSERPMSDYSDAEIIRLGRRMHYLGVSKDSEAAQSITREARDRGLIPGIAPGGQLPKVKVTVIDYGPLPQLDKA
jgi:hypothetical protein